MPSGISHFRYYCHHFYQNNDPEEGDNTPLLSIYNKKWGRYQSGYLWLTD